MKQRVLLNSAILVSFFVLPWWFSALLSIAALFLVKNFWEIIFWGFVLDIFYGIHGGTNDTFYFGTLFALVLYVASVPVRKRIYIS